MKNRRILSVALVILILAAAVTSTASSQQSAPNIVDLGTLGGGGSGASAINERGQVIGQSETATPGQWHAFLWTAQGGMIDLGTLGGESSYPSAINEGGQIVGWSATSALGQPHAFLWTAQGGMIDLGTLGGSYSNAIALNELGQVTGNSETAVSGQWHAFLWTAQAGTIDLGTLGGERSRATAINERGQVIGFSLTASGADHAFLWEKGAMIDLGTLGGDWSAAYAINARGQVVGASRTASGQTHAFLWTAQDGMNDLGTLGGGFSNASDINERGQAAGYSATTSGEQHAVIWTVQGVTIDIGNIGRMGGVTDLSNSGRAVGYNFTNGRAFLWTAQDGMIDLGSLGGGPNYAFSINERGQIVGSSSTIMGVSHAVLWQSQGHVGKEITEIVMPIVQGTDDAGQEFLNCVYQTDFNEIYFGRCVDGSPIASGFRFQNVQIPRGAKIVDAYLEFTVDGTYENEIAIKFFGERSPNALTFSAVDGPGNRPVTESSVPWHLSPTDVWNWAEIHRSPDLAAIVKEIVKLPDWTSGNAMAFIAQSDPAFPGNAHRRVYASEREGTVSAARLIVRYTSLPAPGP